jgi:hypothetical protein
MLGPMPRASFYDGMTPLMYASSSNRNPEAISLFLKAGADLNAMAKNGGTPLMWAQPASAQAPGCQHPRGRIRQAFRKPHLGPPREKYGKIATPLLSDDRRGAP